jgi:hypothetical protein
MCDLFCGRGGWTKGFQSHGWHCVGIDLFPQPDYPGEFIQADVAHLLELPPADFYCCSSICDPFTCHCMAHFQKNPKWPWLGICLFEASRSLLDATGKPYLMENVRCAEKFVGKAVNHCGSFYLWGSGVPAIFPRECYSLTKGAEDYASGPLRHLSKEYRKSHLAEIPTPLAGYIAQTAGALCR